MQDHGDYIFHLDEPTEQPSRASVPLRGWVAAKREVSELRLCGRAERQLDSEERPDVRKAFPAFPFVTGFRGETSGDDLRDGALHFRLVTSAGDCNVTQPLPPPPLSAPLTTRLRKHLARTTAQLRARVASDPAHRWRARRDALLAEIDITRGGQFRRQETDRMLALFADTMPAAVVIQIGANDGATGDPIAHLFARTQWTGILVEPVPYLASALRDRYAARLGVRVEQVAISDQDGEAPLYTLRNVPGQTPEWFNQLATLDRGVLLKHRGAIPEIESLVVEERTETARLETLLARQQVERIDLLVIDTEGHDYEILRQVDFARWRPLLVMLEHQHLSGTDKTKAYKLLDSSGYRFAETPEGDTIAWRRR